MPSEYVKGDIVTVRDKIDSSAYDSPICVVAYIEPDGTIEGMNWLYLVANEPSLNINVHPYIGNYYGIIDDWSEDIVVLSRATTM